jgi:hypothetical protein
VKRRLPVQPGQVNFPSLRPPGKTTGLAAAKNLVTPRSYNSTVHRAGFVPAADLHGQRDRAVLFVGS